MAEMPPPTISIIGAGLSGLVLGRCLRHHGVHCSIYESAAERFGTGRHSYGITLHSSVYTPLLKYLDLDDHNFRKQVAIDTLVGGVGSTNGSPASSGHSFRANRHRLEALLRRGLFIQQDHRLSRLESRPTSQKLHFANGEQRHSDVVVGTEGPHSPTRKAISPTMEFKILPYAVYNGKRRMRRQAFEATMAPGMRGANVLEHREGQTQLQLSINDSTNEEVSLSWTYSRPARPGNDPLFNPDRPNSGAREIPDAFFTEVAGISHNLEGPFREVFDVRTMRQEDRILNWLMRSVCVPTEDLTAATDKNVLLIGDAAHATPILGGNGANEAIRDGIALAEYMVEEGEFGMGELTNFYQRRYEEWQREVEESERRIARMHGLDEKANL